MRSLLSRLISHPRSFVLYLAGLAVVGTNPVYSADGVWQSGQVGTLNWSDGGNWVGSTIPGATTGTTNANLATFGSNTDATLVTIDAGRNLRSLLFNGSNAAGLYTIGSAGANLGEALHLSSGGNLTMALNMTTAITVNAPLILEPASSTTAGVYSILNNSVNAANATTDTNTYKLFINGDISGGTTTSTITLTLGGTAGNRSNNASANIMSGLISDGGAAGGLALSVTGTGGDRGAWSLTNDNNSFTGPLSVSGATLIFGSLTNAGVNSALGAGSVINITSSAQFKYTGPATSTDRTINSNGGIFYSTGSGAVTLTGTVQLNGSLTFRGGQNFIIDTVITGAGGLSRTDSGTVFLNQTNTFSGNISISDGAFRFATIADAGVDSPLGRGSVIQFGQNSGTVGRIEFTGANGGSSNRDITLSNGNGSSSGNGRINNTVAGQTLTLSGSVRATNSTATFVSSLNLTGVGDGVMSGVIGGTTASASTPTNTKLTKDGTGTWALSNANIYYGDTTISAGTLLALNSTGSATGTGNVVTSGSGVLGGTGFVTAADGGSITIANGTSLRVGTTHNVLAGAAGPAGTTSAAGQLSLGTAANVAITLAGTLQFDLFGSSDGITTGLADRLVLNTTASSITLGGIVSVADLTGGRVGWQKGIWQLVDWAGIGAASKTGDFTYNLPTAQLASGYAWNTDDFLTAGTLSIYKAELNQTWTGAVSGSWGDVGNWESGALPSATTDVFFAGATMNLSHTIVADTNVRNLFFSGESDNTINRSGGVLYANGSLLEVLGGNQKFTNAQLRIRNGNLEQFDIYNDGTLDFGSAAIMYHRNDTTGTNDLNLVFSGSGDTSLKYIERRYATYDVNIIVNGPGTVTISSFTDSAADTSQGYITGTTTLNGGTLILNDERNLGGDPASFNPAHLTLNGGTLTADATFTIDDANRGITFGSSGTVVNVDMGDDGLHTLTLASSITGTGNLTKEGQGYLILSGTSTHSGQTIVNEGILQVGSFGVGSSGTGQATIASGAQILGSGTVQASSFILQSGAMLQAGDLISGSTTGNGTLTFTPVTVGAYTIQAGSNTLLSLTSATNLGSSVPAFGGFTPGTTGYNNYVDGITGSGDHDLLVFNGDSGSTLNFSGNLEVVGVGLSPSYGDVYNLLDWSSLLSADFSNFVVGSNRDGSGDDLDQFNLPDISSFGLFWDVSRFTLSGTIAVVPEPSRALLMMLGMTFALLRRRRRH